MLGFNWVDAIIIVLLLVAVVEGVRLGFLSQLFAWAGFFAVLVVAGWVFPHLLPIHDPTTRTVINATLVLLAAVYAALRCFDLGQKVHWSFRLGKLIPAHKLKLLESACGSLLGLAAGLVVVWLVGVMIGRLPFEGLSNSVSDAWTVQQLTRHLPPVPAVFGLVDKHIDPNSQPYVFATPRPQADFNYSVSDFQAAAAKGARSVVRITSFACGGIVSGSGFAVGQHLVATDAHVIAGSKRPIIKYAGKSYEAVPVYFSANLDFAVLRVQPLSLPPLALAPGNVARGSTVAMLGYPSGNYDAVPGIVRDTLAVSARSIYDQGSAGRGVYELQAHVTYGNSGGPIVTATGQTAGIVFSKSTSASDVAFALTSSQMSPAVLKAQTSTRRVSTGACMVD